MSDGDEIVGHKTIATGEINPETGFPALRHEPLTRAEADAFWERAEAEKAKRAADMPTEEDAVRAMWQAYHRLEELGWRNTCYAPADGTQLRLIEPGSTGIHEGHADGEWPRLSFWIHEMGDLWPSRPVLFKPVEPSAAKSTAVDK